MTVQEVPQDHRCAVRRLLTLKEGVAVVVVCAGCGQTWQGRMCGLPVCLPSCIHCRKGHRGG